MASAPSSVPRSASSSPKIDYLRVRAARVMSLSLLIAPMDPNSTPNPNAKLICMGNLPSNSPYTPSPSLSPSPPPPPPAFTPAAARNRPFPQQWQFTQYPPVDEQALAAHDTFKLAEEYGGDRIAARGALFWIEGRRLPSLNEIGLDYFLGQPSAKARGRDFWSVVG
ncbi:hypothetical protein ABVK25_004298 [Lepraria finkii]|uniref:Uncharacterized protein n=1 Tax=Lepraria finkii TaxID=1340010 RepID=A0ABR4BCF1_9LECA